MMETYNQDPNFSIVMPGGCNAECPFCFNNNKTKPKSCSSSIPFVMRFVKGDYKAIEELQEFRNWKEEQNFKKMLTPSQEEG